MAFTFKHGDRPVAGYTVQRAVGRGGFGEVYYAISDGGREVAIKYLRDNPQVELRGVSNCINLKSPHLVSIFDVVRAVDGEYAILMEYISGPSLRDLLIAEPNGLGPEKAAFFLREIAKGLSYLHDRGIVHRDLKPGNIFYDDGYVKIGDYGLSKFISISRHSGQTSSVGTVHYMAPEIGSGNYSRGVDIYALGVILYELLLGRVPFQGSTMAEVLMKHLQMQPEVEHLPQPFGRIIARALQKDPEDRYPSVQEMVDELMAVDVVARSLAGFSTKSLDGAVRKAEQVAARERRQHVHYQPPPLPAAGVAGYGAAVAPVAVPGAFMRPEGVPFRPEAATAYAELSPEAASGRLYYAGFWIRVVAALIDMMAIVAIAGLLGILMRAPPGRDPAFLFVAILYDGLLIGYWNGQTLGKKALGIKVIAEDGRPCSVWRAFARACAGWLNMFTLGLTYLMVAFSEKKRGLHDYIAGTLHVYSVA